MFCVNHPAVDEGVSLCDRCSRPFCNDCVVFLQGRRYCARCKVERLADLRSGVDRAQVQFAGIGRRFAAWWVDGLILTIPMMMMVIFGLLIPTAFMSKQAPPPWFGFIGWAFMPVYIVYEGLMLRARGQTLGKMALQIKVVQANGQPISTGQAWGRALMRAVFVSILSIIDYLPALFTTERTCIHDMAAKTRVVLID